MPLNHRPSFKITSLKTGLGYSDVMSAGNSYCNGNTDHEEPEDEKRRKKCGEVARQHSKSVHGQHTSFTLVDQ